MLSFRSGREADLGESRPLMATSTSEVRRDEPTSHRSSASLWFMVGFVMLLPIVTFMVHTMKPSKFSLRSFADDALRSMQLQAGVDSVPNNTVPKDIEASSSICSITTTLEHVSYDCKGSYINFIVPATAKGLWPDGLTYSLYEAASDNKGLLSKFHYEQGPANLPKRTSCESFSSVLCLDGDFTLNVNKGSLVSMQDSDLTEADRNSMYVDICGSDHRVHAGESYKFSTYNMKCASLTDSGMIPISSLQRNITSTLGIHKAEKSFSMLDSVTNYFHEIFDPKPVADEPEIQPAAPAQPVRQPVKRRPQPASKSASPKVTPHKDGTLNLWSLNPQTGSSKVPVAKEGSENTQPTHVELKKQKRRLLGKGGVRNLEGTKSYVKQKNKFKKLKMRGQASSE